MNKIPITVIIIITKNEERNIGKCLKACKPANQIFVVDSQSTDKTKEIAGRYIPKENIINFEWNGKWPKKKQWSLDNLSISNKWVLLLDADERPTKKFWGEVNGKIGEKNNDADGYFVRYNYNFMGKTLKHGDPVRKLVLFKKDKTHFEKIKNIEDYKELDQEVHSHPIVNGNIRQLKNRIIHDDYKDVNNFIKRHGSGTQLAES